jgi:hypothetical protein
VTVGGERDKVKPNGKNWLNSYGNRLAIPDRTRRTIVTFWWCLSGVT